MKIKIRDNIICKWVQYQLEHNKKTKKKNRASKRMIMIKRTSRTRIIRWNRIDTKKEEQEKEKQANKMLNNLIYKDKTQSICSKNPALLHSLGPAPTSEQ